MRTTGGSGRRLVAAAVALAAGLAACSGTTGPEEEQLEASPDEAAETGDVADEPATTSISLAAATATAFDRVGVEGLPIEAAVETVVHLDGAQSVPRPVLLDEDGPFIIAPVHPTDADGGPVDLRFDGPVGDGVVVTLDVAPPEGADGSFLAAHEALLGALEERASAAGTSTEALADTAIEDLPVAVRHLGVALAWAEIADELVRELTDEELTRLDRIAGAAELEPLFASEGIVVPPLEDAPRSDVAAQAFVGRLAAATGCIDNPVEISTVVELSEAMLSTSAAGKLSARQGPQGRVLEIASGVLSIGGLAPGYLGKVASAMSVELAVFDAAMNGIQGLRPSRLTRLKAEVDTNEFPEDATEPGAFKDLELTAAATGWQADDDIINVLANLASVLTPGAKQRAAADATLEDAIATLGDEAFDAAAKDFVTELGIRAANSTLQSLDTSVVSFCPKTWTVPVDSPGFTQARALQRRLTIDNEQSTYLPREVGSDTLVVEVFPALFLNQYVKHEEAVVTRPITITLKPRIVVKEPGSTIEIRVSVEHAEDDSLVWDIGAGSFAEGATEPNRLLETPGDDETDAYPFEIKVQSMSRQGLREDGEPPRFATSVVTLPALSLTVQPDPAVVAPGGTTTFTATAPDGNEAAVTWSAEGGTIADEGAYQAGEEEGVYTVTAMLRDDETVEGTATVIVLGPCSFLFDYTGSVEAAAFSGPVNGTAQFSVSEYEAGGSRQSAGGMTALNIDTSGARVAALTSLSLSDAAPTFAQVVPIGRSGAAEPGLPLQAGATSVHDGLVTLQVSPDASFDFEGPLSSSVADVELGEGSSTIERIAGTFASSGALPIRSPFGDISGEVVVPRGAFSIDVTECPSFLP